MKTKLLIATMFFGITTLFAQNIPSYVPKNGLVGWWPFNGNANDESGNGNNGTVNGAKLTSDRNGKANTAYDFSLTSSNITTNVKGAIGQKPRTISLWFYYDKPNTSNDQWVMFGYGGATQFTQFVATVWPNDKPCIDIGASYVTYNQNIIGNWHNYTLVYDSIYGSTVKNIKAFIDGKLLTDINLQTSYFNIATENSASFPFRFGTPNALQTFKGKIDDIAYWNRALSDQEIKKLYLGCTKETASSNSFSSPLYTTSSTVSLSAQPNGGVFTGNAITANTFDPSKAKLGKNTIKYNFKNTSGCSDSTNFSLIVADTLGNTCSTYDTLKIKVKLTTGIKANQITSLNVYPNPTSDILIIAANDLDALNGYAYKIVDALGKLVYSKSIQNAITQIPLSSLGVKGTYLLQIIDASGTIIEGKHIVLQ